MSQSATSSAPAAPVRHERSLMQRLSQNRNWLGFLFMLPAAIILILFLAYPLGKGVWLSFTDAKIGRDGVFIGLENYEWLLDDSIFWKSVFNTVVYTVFASIVKFAVGLYLALLLNEKLPFKALIRSVVLIPFVVPTVLSAIAFWWIYDSQFSIISWSLRHMGLITENINFLGDPNNARMSLIFANIWRGVPFIAITLLAGLQTVSPSLYEAATLDGATRWQNFRFVTFPLLTPIIAVVMTFSVLFTFTDFQLVWAMTRGGPVNSTHLMATLGYQRAILAGNLGEGAAIATAMIPFLLFSIMVSWFGLQGMSYLDGGLRKIIYVYLPLAIIMVVLIFPFYWMVLTAVKPDEQLIDMEKFNPFFVVGPTLKHINKLLFESNYPTWLWNTMYVSVVSTFLSLFASVFAAYALVRIRFKGAEVVGASIFLAYLVPPSILFIPLATIIQAYGLFDSPIALILVYPTILIPFSTWLLMGYFKTIPYELEECALIDGATRLQILIKIILPLAVPGLISAGIFSLTLCWNEFIYALTFLSSTQNKTVPVAVVSEFVDGDIYRWGSLMAGALLGSLPLVILYSFFVEHYVSAMTGAVKE